MNRLLYLFCHFLTSFSSLPHLHPSHPSPPLSSLPHRHPLVPHLSGGLRSKGLITWGVEVGGREGGEEGEISEKTKKEKRRQRGRYLYETRVHDFSWIGPSGWYCKKKLVLTWKLENPFLSPPLFSILSSLPRFSPSPLSLFPLSPSLSSLPLFSPSLPLIFFPLFCFVFTIL